MPRDKNYHKNKITMKREFLKIAFLATAMAGVFAACEKEDNNPGDGKVQTSV